MFATDIFVVFGNTAKNRSKEDGKISSEDPPRSEVFMEEDE